MRTRVYAESINTIGRSEYADFIARVFKNRQHVRQIVFALRIVVGNLIKRVEEFLYVEAVNTRVDFRNLFLNVGGVFFLDDFLKRAVGIANDSAVTGGVGHLSG